MRFLTIAVVLTLSACAGDVKRETSSSRPSQQYFDGYAEGCDSGYAAAGHPYYRYRKDLTRIDGAGQFQQGWNDGFAKCKASHESNARR